MIIINADCYFYNQTILCLLDRFFGIVSCCMAKVSQRLIDPGSGTTKERRAMPIMRFPDQFASPSKNCFVVTLNECLEEYGRFSSLTTPPHWRTLANLSIVCKTHPNSKNTSSILNHPLQKAAPPTPSPANILTCRSLSSVLSAML
jgi:hypothetical protein